MENVIRMRVMKPRGEPFRYASMWLKPSKGLFACDHTQGFLSCPACFIFHESELYWGA
jgi:hypothetical protein